MQRVGLLLEAVLVLLLFRTSAAAAAAAGTRSFVTANRTHLLLDGKPFYNMGLNAYWMPSAITKFNDSETVDLVMAAAQRLGLGVVRTWAFNDDFPISPGVYNETHGRALDYIAAAAGRHGLRVVYGLSNMWAAYLGPEAWLQWAEGSAANATVESFYMSNATAALYQQHIRLVTHRVNSITGIAYKDDPTILGWDALNEPRCPGCSAAAMRARDRFIAVLAATLRAAAPRQLTLSSTEGYFAPGDPYLTYNPGAGAQCEGEQWRSEIAYFHVGTTHIYYRQMESLAPRWLKPSFELYCQFLFRKLQLYTALAAQAGRPLIVEEFGLTRRWFNDHEIKVAFAVVADALIAAKRLGMPFMGAWFWNGAPTYQPDMGGYNVYITRTPTGRPVGLGSQAALLAFAAGLHGPSAVPNGTYSMYNASLGVTEPTAAAPAGNQPSAAAAAVLSLPGLQAAANNATSAALTVRPAVLLNQTSLASAALPALTATAAAAAAMAAGSQPVIVPTPPLAAPPLPKAAATSIPTVTAQAAAAPPPPPPPASAASPVVAPPAAEAAASLPAVAASPVVAPPAAEAAAPLPAVAANPVVASPPAALAPGVPLAPAPAAAAAESSTAPGAAAPSSAAVLAAQPVTGHRKLRQLLSSTSKPAAAAAAVAQRNLLEALPAVVVQAADDHLDDFRNAAARSACAERAATTWRIADLGWPINVDKYWQMVARVDMVDILAEATRLLQSDDGARELPGGDAEAAPVVAATG